MLFRLMGQKCLLQLDYSGCLFEEDGLKKMFKQWLNRVCQRMNIESDSTTGFI